MKELPFVRSPYNYDTNAAGDESGVDCLFDRVTGEETPSMTKQSFQEECDINTIVRRFGITGELPQGVRMPSYEDFSGVVTDYHTAMNAVAMANESFDAMPAEVRARFKNDPGEFVDFCSDPDNRAEAEKLGLVVPRKPVAAPVEGDKGGASPPAEPKAPAAANAAESGAPGKG